MNNKYVIGGILALILIISAYFLFSKSSSQTGPKGSTSECLYGKDNKGNCLPIPEKCGQNTDKPSYKCDNDQPIICDHNQGEWRCKLECESDDNPFPTNFKDCNSKNIKCEEKTGKYYCKSDYCQNEGILYSNANGVCKCNPKYKGDKCQCDISKCQGGDIDTENCKCITCCDKDNNTDEKKRCKYYGDDCSKKCDIDNEVYDPTSGFCVCPAGYIKDETQECIPIDCGPNGTLKNKICDCGDSGFKGAKCEIPRCSPEGKWDPTTQTCICNTDDKGKKIAVGDSCQYTKENTCNNNGYPYINSTGSASCNCNSGFEAGLHCSCGKKPDQFGQDKCMGKDYRCEEDTNPPYSGKWVQSYKSCDEIYKDYGLQSTWEENCTKNIPDKTGNYPYVYPANKAVCKPKPFPGSDGQLNDFSVRNTCDAIPTDEMLTNCKNGIDAQGKTIPVDLQVDGGGCYISWKDNSNNYSKSFNSYCECINDDTDNSRYACNIAQENSCGPKPPKGFCRDGSDPKCLSYGTSHIYICDGTSAPESVVKSFFSLSPQEIPDSNDKWWLRSDKLIGPVFPTVDMDICEKNDQNLLPTDQLLWNYNPGWSSLNPFSKKGFIKKDSPDGKTYKFYNDNDERVIKYNVKNAKLSEDKKTIYF